MDDAPAALDDESDDNVEEENIDEKNDDAAASMARVALPDDIAPVGPDCW